MECHVLEIQKLYFFAPSSLLKYILSQYLFLLTFFLVSGHLNLSNGLVPKYFENIPSLQFPRTASIRTTPADDVTFIAIHLVVECSIDVRVSVGVHGDR